MPRWKLFYHLVWATRGRESLIRAEIEATVHQCLRDIAIRHGVVVHAVGGVEDHVHMAVSIPPTIEVAEAIRRIKGGSSHALRQQHGEQFGWQAEYGVDTFGERHLDRVVAYIANQHRHHAHGTVWSMAEEIPDPPTARSNSQPL